MCILHRNECSLRIVKKLTKGILMETNNLLKNRIRAADTYFIILSTFRQFLCVTHQNLNQVLMFGSKSGKFINKHEGKRNGSSLNSKNYTCEMKVQLGGDCADRD